MDAGFIDYEIFPLKENLDNFCSGGNKKQLFLGMAGENQADTVNFVEKIMASVNYDVKNDALTLFLTQSPSFSFKLLDNKFHFKQAIFFGIKPQEAGLKLNVLPYQPLEVAGTQYLFCDSLKKIQEEPNLKRQLWEALKLIFLK